jgi:hypothetical protein
MGSSIRAEQPASNERGIARSTFAALTSALLFGASTPAAKALLGEIDPWLLAGILYLGCGIALGGLVLVWWRVFRRDPRLDARDGPWLLEEAANLGGASEIVRRRARYDDFAQAAAAQSFDHVPPEKSAAAGDGDSLRRKLEPSRRHRVTRRARRCRRTGPPRSARTIAASAASMRRIATPAWTIA